MFTFNKLNVLNIDILYMVLNVSNHNKASTVTEVTCEKLPLSRALHLTDFCDPLLLTSFLKLRCRGGLLGDLGPMIIAFLYIIKSPGASAGAHINFAADIY